jgi:YT521-B-like domain
LSRRFQIKWCCKAQTPFSHFLHIRVKDNFEGSNESTCITLCNNGTEISQLAGTEILRVFETLHGTPPSPSTRECAVLEDRWTVLMNSQSFVAVHLKLLYSIQLDSDDGDYGITISSDGRYVAAGSRVIEVFSVKTGLGVWRFDLPNGNDEMHCTSFNHDSTHLAAGGECGVIYVSTLISFLTPGSAVY